MLYYALIENSEGLDQSEGQDVVHSSKLLSKQCNTCCFFYYIIRNFKYSRNICDGCFHYRTYESDNKHLILRIITLKRGTYRTISNYFYDEVVEILEKINPTRKFGCLKKEDIVLIEANDETKKWDKIDKNSSWIMFKVRSLCGIEPQSLINEGLAIRLQRFVQLNNIISLLKVLTTIFFVSYLLIVN